ncbi:integral membrane protein DUF92-domain-containing protein, partial [Dimargaris cristalligena]
LLMVRSFRNRSLSVSGCIAAGLVGLGTFSNDLVVFTVTLLVFFLASSKLTRFQSERKRAIEAHHVEGGQRDMWQVFSNGWTGTLLAVLSTYFFAGRATVPFYGDTSAPGEGALRRALLLAYVAHYACCNGDTWASELGTLHRAWPRLITTGRPVPSGTNGGVSSTGLLASLAGGTVIGLAANLALYLQALYRFTTTSELAMTYPSGTVGAFGVVLLAGVVGGLVGSLVDSLLGAVLQCSYVTSGGRVANRKTSSSDKWIAGHDILNNNQVNFISSLTMALAI